MLSKPPCDGFQDLRDLSKRVPAFVYEEFVDNYVLFIFATPTPPGTRSTQLTRGSAPTISRITISSTDVNCRGREKRRGDAEEVYQRA